MLMYIGVRLGLKALYVVCFDSPPPPCTYYVFFWNLALNYLEGKKLLDHAESQVWNLGC